MHPELKALIKNLPDMIITEFHAQALPYTSDYTFPVPVTTLFNLIRSECLITAGVRLNMAAEMDQVRKYLGPKHKVYRRRTNENEIVNILVSAMRRVLEGLTPQLYVSLSAFLLDATNEGSLLRQLGTHFSDSMDKDLPFYVQLAIEWHRNWCESQVPTDAHGNYPYPHNKVPVVAFMRAIVAIGSSEQMEIASPWLPEIRDVVTSKIDWLSPTEIEILKITAAQLTRADVDNDFIKYLA